MQTSYNQLSQLGVAELKRRCSELRLSTAGIMEKPDLVDLLFNQLGAFAQVDIATFETNLDKRGHDKPVIFLDVDGVVNGRLTYDPVARRLDPACVSRLAKLLIMTDASVVLSSTWRHHARMKLEVAEALWNEGVPRDCFVGQTPNFSIDRRTAEILEWLREHPETKQFVVIDDLPLTASDFAGRFVQTDPELGLTDDNISRAQFLLAVEG